MAEGQYSFDPKQENMNKDLQQRHKELIEKQTVLQQAKETLKTEFVGIDQVIEEVVDAISSWYLFPEIQEKPVIINLWGLTGVGKSSLVNRLVQLISMEQKYYYFDLGESENRDWNVQRTLQEIYENVNGYPIILALDEFQHARTLDDLGAEKEKSSSRIIWQLLDSGKFKISKFSFHQEEIYDLIKQLRYLLSHGVQVSKGKVTAQVEYFMEKMDPKNQYTDHSNDGKQTDSNTQDVLFVPARFYESIFDMVKEKYSTTFELQEKLLSLEGYETLAFLLEVFELGNSPKTVDCSKGLIFVLGNLDEAYTMSHNFNPDMDADEFHEQSLKINVPIIKRALQRRFRNEQIARLGNLHIIYPAFSKQSFQKIINLELGKIEEKVYRNQGVKLQIDSSLHDFIYKEAVYPTQGTRPIFTTIHQVIQSKLGKIITEMILKNLEVSCIAMKLKENHIHIDYYREQILVHSLSIQQKFILEDLRKSKQNDLQAIIAVHESGHAIIATILLRTVPEVIFSNTAEVETGGFVHTKFKWNYISKQEVINRLALYLGGYAAERLVFGEENVTTGAEDDIRKATAFITGMLKEAGMGDIPGAFDVKAVETKYFLHDEDNELGKKAVSLILKALELAEKTLGEQKLWLLKMADYLSDHSQMRKDAILHMAEKYAVNFDLDSLIEDGDFLFYRNHLKAQVSELENLTNPRPLKDAWGFSLNMRSENKGS